MFWRLLIRGPATSIARRSLPGERELFSRVRADQEDRARRMIQHKSGGMSDRFWAAAWLPALLGTRTDDQKVRAPFGGRVRWLRNNNSPNSRHTPRRLFRNSRPRRVSKLRQHPTRARSTRQ